MITMVKKVLPDGSECSKCREVIAFLQSKKLLYKIDRILYADPSDPDGEGMKLVKLWNMKKAPFFVVEEKRKTVVYSSVMELLKKEL